MTTYYNCNHNMSGLGWQVQFVAAGSVPRFCTRTAWPS